MSRILVFGDGGFLSHTTRPLEIAKRLRHQGHDVQFAVSGPYSRLVREADFDVHDIATVPPERILSRSRKGRCDWYTLDHVRMTVAADLELFDRLRPDLVLGDFRHSLHTSCEMHKVPFTAILNASWTNYYSVRFRAPEHMLLTHVVGAGILNRIEPWVKAAVLRKDVFAHNQFRRQVGLAPLENVWHMFSGDINLLTDIPEYGPTQNLPHNFHYVGPMLWEPALPAPEWLRDLDPQRPTLYFTMGSTGHAKYLKVAIDHFADSEYQCLMTTGGLWSPPAVPRNFHVCEYAPGSELLRRSFVVVCQGGNGTIYQALQQGVPIIGIATMHDQEFNLQRVTDLGFGIQLSDLKFEPKHLQRAVAEVRQNARYAQAARHYQDILSRANGSVTAARLIEEYLHTRAAGQGSAGLSR
jgi:UDP:flavonoid glycosyltransferase YjiC (YdhE family)